MFTDWFWNKFALPKLDAALTADNAKAAVDKELLAIGEFVAGTGNTIDDAVLAEVEKDVDFDHWATVLVEKARAVLGLKPSRMFTANTPHLFLGGLRLRLVNRVMKEKGCSRAEARAQVAKASDDFLLTHAEKVGIKRGAIGDGSFLQWLVTHLPDLLKLIEMLLPLILAL